MLECPNCEKTSSGSSCRLCGWTVSPKPKVQETHAPAKLTTYPEPTPEDDVLIRAEIARAKALLGMSPEPTTRRAGLPDVDPAIREKLQGASQ